MKTLLRRFALFLSPFILMIVVNEACRIMSMGEFWEGENCSILCHDTNEHCKKAHSRLPLSWRRAVDIPYEGLISKLGEAGNYRRNNVLYLVALWPMLMYGGLLVLLYQKEKFRALSKRETDA